MSKSYKHLDIDKDDGFMPPRDKFLHDDWRVSNFQENFHLPKAWAYRMRGPGWSQGVQKRVWKISPHGVRVDGYNNGGKSDR